MKRLQTDEAGYTPWMDVQTSEIIVRLCPVHRVHQAFMGLGPDYGRSLDRTREPFPLRRCYKAEHGDRF